MVRLTEAAKGNLRGAVLLGITWGLLLEDVANLFCINMTRVFFVSRQQKAARLLSYRFILVLQADRFDTDLSVDRL